MDRGKSLLEEQAMRPETGQLLMDMSDKLVILDGDGNKEDDEMDKGKSAELAEQMAAEEERFNSYRSYWESSWGSHGCGQFPDMTQVSPMHFTNLIPGCCPKKSSPLNSKKSKAVLICLCLCTVWLLPEISWIIIAIFSSLVNCDRSMSQKLNQDDSSLCLVGPSRAISFWEPVYFEVQLRVR